MKISLVLLALTSKLQIIKKICYRVGRNIDGFGLSPGITKDQRLGVENLMKKAFANLTGDLAGTYYPLTGMEEAVRKQLVDDHFLFMSGDANLKVRKFFMLQHGKKHGLKLSCEVTGKRTVTTFPYVEMFCSCEKKLT